MPSVLNTNVASLFASNNLQNAQSRMANSVERLSSGMRINRAKDDAAGLGIATSLTSQINGANQGIRNVNDGISLVQTAEGAISAAADMGQRILTLATQAVNSSLSLNDRKSIQAEMASLITGISSISTRTKFGDKVLLGASTTEGVDAAGVARYKVQVSNDVADTISLTNDAFRTLGTGSAASTEVTTITLTSDFINGQVISIGGRTVTVGAANATVASVRTALLAGDANTTVVGGANSATPSGSVTAGFTLAAGPNANQITATFTANTAVSDIVITSSGNPGFTVSTVQGSAAGTGQTTALNTSVTAYLAALNAGGGEAAYIAAAAVVQQEASNFLTALSTQRSKLGALQNQMESTVDNVQELSSNLSSARSRIQDTDYATETAALTKGQILQQAATAMLAQANQMPNVILSLLK